MEPVHGEVKTDGEVQAVPHGADTGAAGEGTGKARSRAMHDDERIVAKGGSRVPRKGRRTSGYVYLIGPVEGCYKIGKSSNPESRLQAMGLLGVAETLHKISSDRPHVIEQYLHVAFAHRFAEGIHKSSAWEWFRLDDSEVTAFCSIPFADREDDLPASIIALKARNHGIIRRVFGRPPQDPAGNKKLVGIRLSPGAVKKLAEHFDTVSMGAQTVVERWAKRK